MNLQRTKLTMRVDSKSNSRQHDNSSYLLVDPSLLLTMFLVRKTLRALRMDCVLVAY